MGLANSVPIVMILNKEDGSIEKFFTVTTVASYTTTPKFQTHNAFFFEEEDPQDGNPYIYLSFLMNTYYMKIVKFKYDATYFDVMFNKFQYVATTAQLPIQMFPDSRETSQIYLGGQINAVGGIMKFNRDSGRVAWYQTFSQLTVVSSMIEVENEAHIIGCGWYTTDLSAGFFRLGNDGQFQYFYKVSVDTATSATNKCYGITYDRTNALISLLF